MQLDVSNKPDIEATDVQLKAGRTRLWHPEQSIQQIADPSFVGTIFPDAALIHPAVVPAILEQAAKQPANEPCLGGKKVRTNDVWNLPEMQLLTQRALLLFCRAAGTTASHVVDRWANVMQQGECSSPHCHYESDAAVVYFMDPGDGGPGKNVGGTFELVDPRIPFCCPSRPQRPTRRIAPAFMPGMLVIFPAEMLHWVTPYRGQKPRITLAWNISAGLPPAGAAIDPTKPVAAVINQRGT